MSFYIYSPQWFSGIDSLLEIITIITSLIISYYSFKTYKLFEIKRYKYFSISFLLFAIAFITKIISNLIIIMPVQKQIILPYLTYTYTSYIKLDIIENISFTIHKITLLLSILILFFILNKEKNIESIILTSILIIILGFLIKNYILFNFVIILILSYIMIISIIKDKIKYRIKSLFEIKKYSNISKFLIGLNLSYLTLFLAVEEHTFYFLGETILALTFMSVLISIIKIFKK